MRNKNQSGFSLIELLLVVVIIGVISTIAVPSLLKARAAAENGGAYAMLRTVATLQTQFYAQKNRYARLGELNVSQNNGLGTVSGTTLTRQRFIFEMTPAAPTDAELANGYTVTATRIVGAGETPIVYSVNQTGAITP